MAQPASGKPSLIDSAHSADGPAREGAASIRMLDALDARERPANGVVPTRRGFVWPLAVILLLVACGASWSWWSRRAHADDLTDRMAQVVNASSTSTGTALQPTPATPASAAGVAAEPAPALTATIVATAESMLPAVAEPASAAAPTSAPSASASEAAPTSEALAGAAPASPVKTKNNASTPARDTRAAAPPNADRKSATRTPAAANRTTAAAPNGDPDVALLSAMLATMSRDARASADSAPSPQTQLTIAQLVQRCEQRGIKDAIETFECKRRICDGYWGKADACPKSLSPKKN